MHTLKEIEKNLPQLIRTAKWNSYFIDWVFPMEARLWTEIDGIRFSLQKFYPCSEEDCYYHNHPWRKSMKIVKGSIIQGISTSYNAIDYFKTTDENKEDIHQQLVKNTFSEMEINSGSYFSIHSPNCWHYIYPLNNEPVYALMVTYEPWFKGPKSPNKKIKQVSQKEQADIIKNILECL